jgi:mannan endo-1,4-beta-mannosidase
MTTKAAWAARLTFASGILVVAAATTVPLYAFNRSTHAGIPPSAPAPVAAPLGSDGAYVGVAERGVDGSWDPVRRFAHATHTDPQLVLTYTAWGGPFPQGFADRAYAHKAIPMIQMEPRATTMAAVARGDGDSYLEGFAASVRAYRHPVVIGFAPEMNGHWYPWGWQHVPPTVWVAAWRHVVTVFRTAGATNVTWLWTISHSTSNTGPLRNYWPGSRYVTWVGIDGYYYTHASTFVSVFGTQIRRVRDVTSTPILLSETGIGPIAGQARKIPGLFGGITRHHLLGAVWYDVRQRGGPYKQDWRLEGHPAALRAFHRGVISIHGS